MHIAGSRLGVQLPTAMEALQSENTILRQKLQQLELELQHARHNPAECATSADPKSVHKGPQHAPHTRAEAANGAVGGNKDTEAEASSPQSPDNSDEVDQQPLGRTFISNHSLSKAQVERYSRQLLLPAFGVAAQDKLCSSSVLIVGCGGLGSPAALYLAAAGMGRIGLVDHDTVDLTNLHRQIIHSERTLRQHKAESAAAACRALNSSIIVETHTSGLHPSNAVQIISQYDIVIDASDNPATRYLINDACVACKKPLVSAAAVGTDGQLTIYNHGPEGPCYRCLFPVAPNPENCSKCSEAGVLGPVPGVLGTLQALEAIKLATGIGHPLSRQLLLYDSLSTHFMNVKLRSKVPGCAACGAKPSITRESIAGYDYAAFTGQPAHDGPMQPLQVLQPEQRISPAQLQQKLQLQQQQQGYAGEQVVKQQQQEEGVYADEQVLQQQQQQQQQQQLDGGQEEAGKQQQEGCAGEQVLKQQQQQLDGGQGGVGPQQQQHEQQEVVQGEGPLLSKGTKGASFLLLDVRPAEQFAIMSLPGAVNIPYGDTFDQQLPQVMAAAAGSAAGGAVGASAGGLLGCNGAAGGSTDFTVEGEENETSAAGAAAAAAAGTRGVPQTRPVVVMCRRGNHSQLAVEKLRALGLSDVVDVVGGYEQWVREVDAGMPLL